MSGMSGSLQPTWFGHVSTARDALILFEACLTGHLHHVPRRPHDRERGQLMKSGCVFIYEENASGIKRWTDGLSWSPSRILGNFLIYRELLKPFPPGEKKRATKKSKRPSRSDDPTGRSNSCDSPLSPTTPSRMESISGIEDREQDRALIGSLVDSYGFKEDGLVKKTMSVQVNGVHHHLVSYYCIKDAKDGTLNTPSGDSRLSRIKPRPELVSRQNFRAPLDEAEDAFPETIAGGFSHGYAYNLDRHLVFPSISGTEPPISPYPGLPPAASPMPPPIGYGGTQVPPSPSYYAPSNMTSPTEHKSPFPASPPPYGYRPSQAATIPPLLLPNTPRAEWERAGNPSYGDGWHRSGLPGSGMPAPYPSGTAHWPMSSASPQSPPHALSGWGPQDYNWHMHHAQSDRPGHYNSPPSKRH